MPEPVGFNEMMFVPLIETVPGPLSNNSSAWPVVLILILNVAAVGREQRAAKALPCCTAKAPTLEVPVDMSSVPEPRFNDARPNRRRGAANGAAVGRLNSERAAGADADRNIAHRGRAGGATRRCQPLEGFRRR